MSFERPSPGLLVFQCDVCFDTFELSKEDTNIQDFRSCWAVMREEGWTMKSTRSQNGSGGRGALAYATEHMCSDCSKTAKADRTNPFRH
jgi:hypothetical protein